MARRPLPPSLKRSVAPVASSWISRTISSLAEVVSASATALLLWVGPSGVLLSVLFERLARMYVRPLKGIGAGPVAGAPAGGKRWFVGGCPHERRCIVERAQPLVHGNR